MSFVITAIHIIACLALIIIVLLQQGKGASMGAAFGGSSQTVFGSGGATPFLGKVTTGVAIVFMLTSLSLGLPIFRGHKDASVVDQAATQPPAQEAPAQAGQTGASDSGDTKSQQ